MLLDTLQRLEAKGNTLVVVEHDAVVARVQSDRGWCEDHVAD